MKLELRNRHTLAWMPALLLAFAAPAAAFQDEEESLDPEAQAQLQELLAATDAAAGDDVLGELSRQVMRVHGHLEPVLTVLEQQSEDEQKSDDERRKARHLLAHLAWRQGDLEQALASFEILARDDAAPESLHMDAQWAEARLLDATGRPKEAQERYGQLMTWFAGTPVETRLRLRMALLAMELGGDEEKDALAKFAAEVQRTSDERNRASVVLALLDRPADAIELYEVEGTGAKLFRAKIRIAEWAIRAEQAEVAQDTAWEAVHAATLKRDRRYALAVLIEAHRLDESLDALLAKFKEAAQLDDDSRGVWIELLRETQRFDEAIALFKQSGGVGSGGDGGVGGAFSVEDRRELLEMYREADREEEMLDAYRELIAAEPTEVTWRDGLARYHLERGDRQAADRAWLGFENEPEADLLLGAQWLRELGQDELALGFARRCVDEGRDPFAGILFLFELHRDRGRLDEASAMLEELDGIAAPGDPVRFQLSEGFEQLGQLVRATRVLEELRDSRPEGETGEDMEMRLAWLYSEIGEEEKALAAWDLLWRRINSIPRRRYVEDRMMTVASRLGRLADIAVDLEQKLIAGEADARDSGLLVRLYTKVSDAVSAAEVIDEFLENTGGNAVDALQEKARVYLACTDYYHYEETVRELIELDPEGEGDYLRQLAMSQLERGKPDEAREVLARLSEIEEVDSDSAEFEAGVLSLAGMREEAVACYARGLADHPERIDSYLLMANLMRQLGQIDEAVGMFQYLAETAQQDDLFTIAIDGLLNMLVDAPPRPAMLAWARRITLERLAERHDKMYLYQLLSDLAEEAQQREAMITALETSLSISGSRRSAVLRELMDLAHGQGDSFTGRGWEGNEDKHLAFGRRLVGLEELVPPQVYLDLGEAFLEAKDPTSAAKTFRMARDLPDYPAFQRRAAGLFEQNGFEEQSLRTYSAVLATRPTDVSLLAKVGELEEQLGSDTAALNLNLRALDLLLTRRPLSTTKAVDEDEPKGFYWMTRNVDDWDQNSERVIGSLLATLTPGDEVQALLDRQRSSFSSDLAAAREQLASEGDEPEQGTQPSSEEEEREKALGQLESFPRAQRRAEVHRRLALAFGHVDQADGLDRELLAAFPEDEGLLESIVRTRLSWGLIGSARALVESSGRPEAERLRVSALFGGASEGSTVTRPIPMREAAGRVLALVTEGRAEELENLLRRVDFGKVEQEDLGLVSVIYSGARYLDDPDLLLRVARQWGALTIRHGNGYWELQNMLAGTKAALGANERKGLYQFLISTILADEEKRGNYVTILPTWQKEFEEPLLDEEQVLTILDQAAEKGQTWGMAPVLALVSEEQRVGVVRSLWPKVPKTGQARFLVDLISSIGVEMGQPLADFTVDTLREAMGENAELQNYTLRQLGEGEENRETALRAVEVMQEFRKEDPLLDGLRARTLMDLGRQEEGLALAGKAWLALDDDGADWTWNNEKRALEQKLLPDHLDVILAAIEEAEAQAPEADAEQWLVKRVTLMQRHGGEEFDTDSLIAEALERFPESKELVKMRLARLRSQGRSAQAALVIERLIELEPEETQHHRDLFYLWVGLQHETKALAAWQAWKAAEEEHGDEDSNGGRRVPMGGIMIVGGVVYMGGDSTEPTGLPRDIASVKKAIEEDDQESARAILRRLWRNLQKGEPSDPYGFGRFGRWSPMSNLSWPADEKDAKEDETEEEQQDPPRGGLADWSEEQPEKPEERPNAYEKLAEHDFALEELWRFVRSRKPSQLESLDALFKGLLAGRARLEGEREVFDALLAKSSSGAAGKLDHSLLLAMLDAHPDWADEEVLGAMGELTHTVNPRDASQLRRLARAFARTGGRKQALRLYRWCATRIQSANRVIYVMGDEQDQGSTVSAAELVEDAKDVLEGDERIAFVEMVLELGRPGDDDSWSRQYYERLVLETWEEMLGPLLALERTRKICEDSGDLSTGLRRDVARRATHLYARAGELEAALRRLEVSICKLDPGEIAKPPEPWNLLYFARQAERSSSLSTTDLKRLFPHDPGEDWQEYPAWLEAAGDALLGWLEAERLEPGNVLRPLALITRRLATLERSESAQRFAQALLEFEDLSHRDLLWVADAAREAKLLVQAERIERELFEAGRLHVERQADVLRAVAEADGAETALELGRAASERSEHPRLLDTLVELAQQAGDVPAATSWRERSEAAAAAKIRREELQEEEKLRKEAEKKG